MTVNVALPIDDGYAVLLADTVMTLLDGMTFGGVYKPAAVMVPTVALPPVVPFTSQTTVFGEIGTYALNCCVEVTSSDDFVGYTTMPPATCARAGVAEGGRTTNATANKRSDSHLRAVRVWQEGGLSRLNVI